MKPIDDPNDQSFVGPGPTHASGSELPPGVAAACRPNDALVQAIIRAAEEHYQQQNLVAALQSLRLLDALAAHTPDTLQTIGNLSLLLGEHEPAGEAYRRALALKPDNVSLLVSLALVDFRLHNHPDSNGFLSRALTLEPEHLDALKILADWNLGQQRYQEAALTYGKLIGKEPARVELFLSLAKCFFELGDKATAESALQHALHLEPHNQLARENLSALRGLKSQPLQTATCIASCQDTPQHQPLSTATPTPAGANEHCIADDTPDCGLPTGENNGVTPNVQAERNRNSSLSSLTSRTPFPMRPPERSLAPLIAQLRLEKAVMAEIGSYIGESALQFLGSGRFKTVYCIDFWTNGYAPGDFASNHCAMDIVEATFDKNTETQRASSEIVKVKMESRRASARFENQKLDFVYIDGNHQAAPFREDLEAWLPKVRLGGYIGGHDFSQSSVGQVVFSHFNFEQSANKTITVFPDDSWLVTL